MSLFWHGLLAAELREVGSTYMMFQQNQLFRGHTADNYGTLLRSIVHDAAMIRYLDNHRNYKGKGNENLGREILELFSMGEGQSSGRRDRSRMRSG